MSLFDEGERGRVRELVQGNPFGRKRMKALQAVLEEPLPRRKSTDEPISTNDWSQFWDRRDEHLVVERMKEWLKNRVKDLPERVISRHREFSRLRESNKLSAKDLDAYQRDYQKDLDAYQNYVFAYLYHILQDRFDKLIAVGLEKVASRSLSPARLPCLEKKETALVRELWKEFHESYNKLLPEELDFSKRVPQDHLFALGFQYRRAYVHIFTEIIGNSEAVARLRASVWQSIFTADMRRYWDILYRHMEKFTTLITGPSGTGKEQVAKAIAMSRYIPFDSDKKCFQADFAGSFHDLSLSDLAPGVFESELFGHVKGSFTGAITDRNGALTVCGAHGTVFFDEIGELEPKLQVKLLRVLQSRQFRRIGDTETILRFEGKIVAATNRDLATEVNTGRFRKDLYYRICTDQITTPALRDQLNQSPKDLGDMVRFISMRLAGKDADEEDVARIVEKATDWIDKNLPKDYGWPGNFRELEQCVESYLIQKEYKPLQLLESDAADIRQALAAQFTQCKFTATDLKRTYFTMVRAGTETDGEAARKLRVNWRTVVANVDEQLLAEMGGKYRQRERHNK